MITMTAKGTARFDNFVLDGQEVVVVADDDSIKNIEYGMHTTFFTQDKFEELLENPEGYWAVPERPKPNTIKAAIVAACSMWDPKDVVVDGKIEEEEPPDAGDGSIIF